MNKIKSVYRSFFQWLTVSEHLTRNPAALLILSKSTSRPTIPTTMEEVDILLDTIHRSNSPLATRDGRLFAIYAFSGIRRSEALRLRVSDYDNVAQTLRLHNTKGGGNRVQPIPQRLARMLEQYVGQRHLPDARFLFPGDDGQKPLSARQANSRFDFWKRLAGLRKGLTIRSIRAGFATRLYRTTRDIWLVARALGHVGLQTVRRYLHADTTDVWEAVEWRLSDTNVFLEQTRVL